MISLHAPPAPKCFPDRVSWIEYLHAAQASLKSPNSRPFKGETYQPEFLFCRDCLPATRREKAAQGLCHPPVIAAKKKEPADAA